MVKIFKNLMLYWRFRSAVNRCEKLNAKPHAGGDYIVINFCGRPAIVNYPLFKLWHKRGIVRWSLTWYEVYLKRVTRKKLEQWLF